MGRLVDGLVDGQAAGLALCYSFVCYASLLVFLADALLVGWRMGPCISARARGARGIVILV